MPASAALLENLEDDISADITHIGLVDELSAELTGGSPAYARLVVTWVDDGTGVIRPSANLTFDIPANKTVAGWRGFSALTAGTNYGGPDLAPESYLTQGTYVLLAAQTAIRIA